MALHAQIGLRILNLLSLVFSMNGCRKHRPVVVGGYCPPVIDQSDEAVELNLGA
jgi:hypothetical protein